MATSPNETSNQESDYVSIHADDSYDFLNSIPEEPEEKVEDDTFKACIALIDDLNNCIGDATNNHEEKKENTEIDIEQKLMRFENSPEHALSSSLSSLASMPQTPSPSLSGALSDLSRPSSRPPSGPSSSPTIEESSMVIEEPNSAAPLLSTKSDSRFSLGESTWSQNLGDETNDKATKVIPSLNNNCIPFVFDDDDDDDMRSCSTRYSRGSWSSSLQPPMLAHDRKIVVKFVKTQGYDLKVPCRQTAGSAGYDIFMPKMLHPLKISKGSMRRILTGFRIQMPQGIVGKISIRSCLAKRGCIILGGIIDSDFRGQIVCLIGNVFGNTIFLHSHQRFAQITFEPVCDVTFETCERLGESERGEGGFGSTGDF